MKIKLLSDDLRQQDVGYATDGSCAIDLRAILDEPLEMFPGETRFVHTGIALGMSQDEGALVLPRSGLGNKGIVLSNLVGLIDSDYQGEIMLSLWNRGHPCAHGPEPFVIHPFDRVAQLLFFNCVRPNFEFVTEFNETTERGENGFGSTGR